MPATFNNRATPNIGSDLTVIFQAATKTIVIGCLLSNKAEGYMPVTVVQRNGVNVDAAVAPNETVKGGRSFDAALGRKIVLLAGEKLMASTPLAGAFDAIVSVLEGVS